MKPLYSEEEFDKAKYYEKLPCRCCQCNKIFYITKHRIQGISCTNPRTTAQYCSRKCKSTASRTKILVSCKECNINFLKTPSEIKKTKNNFCSQTCAATYNNKHKTTGNRRSKLEVWLESKLPLLYPELEFHFNRKDTINSELDIYIPSIKLAFELNGIFHYEPIHGEKKFNQIQNNDNNKFNLCQKHNISLCVIDSSKQTYFKPVNSQKYLDIITNIIEERLLSS